jgi:ribonuclease HII
MRSTTTNPFESYSPIAGELHLRSSYPGVILIGIDEAGRGPLAGPVVASAVVLHSPSDIEGLNDSKKLSEIKREELFPCIQERALCWAIGAASASEIDAINILQANYLAMRRALSAIGFPGLDVRSPVGESAIQVWSKGQIPLGTTLCVVDGNQKIRGVPLDGQFTVVKGDAHIASIAAASILAKVHRDRVMVALAAEFPEYNFAKHKGYPSAEHTEAIRVHGLCAIHRKSFRLKALDQPDLFG